MSKVSVTIITYNEEKNIRECLESVQGFDEIIVVDSFSTDNTVQIAKEYTAKVYQVEWKGYVAQNNTAIEYASYDWILRLDGDERVSQELASEIRNVLIKSNDKTGYRVPHKNFFMGRFLKRSEKHHVRLFKKGFGRWVGGKVHERVSLQGKIGRLSNPILHFSHPSLSKSLDKINLYTSLQSEGKIRLPILVHMVFSSAFAFFREYFLFYRILDGIPGFIYSREKSFYTFIKYAKRWERARMKMDGEKF